MHAPVLVSPPSNGIKYLPDESLAGILSHFYEIRLTADAPPETHHLQPSLEMMLIFNWGSPVAFSFGDKPIGQHTIHTVGIIGPLRRMMNYELMPDANVLVLNFTLNGFYRFLALNMDNMSQEDYIDQSATQYMQQLEQLWLSLAAIDDNDIRIKIITQYLNDRIAPNEQAALPLLSSVPDFDNPAINPVKAIAQKSALTERTVQLRFKKYVGYSTKQLIRYLRFKQVMLFINKNPHQKINWFELIGTYGYHDQSHLIKDFKYYTGVTPRQFIKLNSENSLC
jgi:AraC-like DNA-binding protein